MKSKIISLVGLVAISAALSSVAHADTARCYKNNSGSNPDRWVLDYNRTGNARIFDVNYKQRQVWSSGRYVNRGSRSRAGIRYNGDLNNMCRSIQPSHPFRK